ncbi:MAG: hypothetical protein ABWX96_21380 [Propionibacteriaceae bacterium]
MAYAGPNVEVLVQVWGNGKGRVLYKVYNSVGRVQLSTDEAIRVLRGAADQIEREQTEMVEVTDDRAT